MGPEKSHFLMVWQFSAKPGKEPQFEAAYGPDGVWVQFFRKGPGYGGTRLVQDVHCSSAYFTLDSWDSRAAYEQFRQSHAQEYAAVDRVCETLTEREMLLGMFEGVPTATGASLN